MAKQKDNQEKRKLIRRLRNHYKLAILNIDTFEERFSLLLTPLNGLIIGGIGLVAIISVTFLLLGYTPLRFYLPNYAEEIRVKRLAVEAIFKADSMEVLFAQQNAFIQNFQGVVDGTVGSEMPDSSIDSPIDPKKVEFSRSEEDSVLRAEIEKEDLVNLNPQFNRDNESSYLLFPPIKGAIIDKLNTQKQHYGVDIAAPKDTPIKAIEDGTIIIAAYTAETGYILQIQHDNDLISVYKHNSVLLKKQGEKVRVGEAIAIIGETGEFSSGPHLHFEMWRNGVALNPESFFSFE